MDYISNFDKEDKPDLIKPILNRINQMADRQSEYDIEIFKKIALIIAHEDARLFDDSKGLTYRKNKIDFNYKINGKVLFSSASKDINKLLNNKNKFIEKFVY